MRLLSWGGVLRLRTSLPSIYMFRLPVPSPKPLITPCPPLYIAMLEFELLRQAKQEEVQRILGHNNEQ